MCEASIHLNMLLNKTIDPGIWYQVSVGQMRVEIQQERTEHYNPAPSM
jgi:hypothetical protein